MTKAETSPSGPVEVRDLVVWLDTIPTRKLGQDFAHGANTVCRIAVVADLLEDSYPVEVSPGLDSLTLGLLERCSRAVAVEIGYRLTARLPRTVTEHVEGCAPEPIEEDTLKVSCEDSQIAPDAPVANLPYNVSVPVLLHMFAELPTIRRVFVMMQSEAVDWLAVQPGSKTCDTPNVKTAHYGTVRRAGVIDSYVLWLVLKVDSRLMCIDCYARSDAPEISDVSGALETAPWEISSQPRARLFPLIDAAFAQHHRTLRAALSGIYGSGAAAKEALMVVEINPGQRGEKLEIADFVRLAEISH